MKSFDVPVVCYDGSVADRVKYMKHILPVALHCLVTEAGGAVQMRDRRDRLKEALVNKAISAYNVSMNRIASGEEPLDIGEARRALFTAAGAFTRKRQAADYFCNHVPESERPVNFG